MIREKTKVENMLDARNPLVIDLTGPDGNAFVLMAIAKKALAKFSKERLAIQNIDPEAVIEEMMTGDYENLIQVFDRVLGDYFILER